MNLLLVVFFCLSFCIRLCFNMTASIDLNSSYTFSSALIKSQTMTINGQEVVLILFANGSISKLNNQLVFQQSIKLSGGIKIADFEISLCLNCTVYTPSIIAIHSSRMEYSLVSLINTTKQVLFTWGSVIVKVFPYNTQVNSSSAYALDMVMYSANKLRHYRYINWTTTTEKASENFTDISTYGPIVNIARYDQYYVFWTKNNYVHVYNSINCVLNSKSTPLSGIRSVFTDYLNVGLAQTTTNVAGFSLSNSSVLSTDSNLSSKITSSSSYLKAIRPSPSALALTPTSERIFIFNNQIIKVNKCSNYLMSSVLANNLNFSSSSNMSVVFFQSSKIGFIHSSNSTKAYIYSQNFTASSPSCPNPTCSQFGTGCLTCNSTDCINCFTDYNFVNGTCYPQCNITNCEVCDTLFICMTCASGYSLNSFSTSCDLTITNTTTNATITNNTITNTTTNTTFNFVDNSPTNSTDNYTIITNPSDNSTDNTTNTSDFTNTTDSTNITGIVDPGNSILNITLNNTIKTTDPNSNGTNTPVLTDPTAPNYQPLTSPFTEPATLPAITKIYSSFGSQTNLFIIITSLINSSPYYRLIFAFLSPIFGLFDDYWFYIYHNNSFEHLALFPRLLIFMYAINQQRIIPDFLQETIDKCDIPKLISAQQSYQNYTSPRVLLIDEKPVYMLENLRQLLLGQWIFLFLIFTLVAITIVFLKKRLKSSTEKSNLSNKKLRTVKTQNMFVSKSDTLIVPSKCHAILKFFTQYLEQTISFKNILLCLLGQNLIFVSFQLGTQFQIFFALDSVDKVNIIVSLVLGLVFVIAFLVLFTLNQSLFEKVSQIGSQNLKKLWHEDMEMVIFHCIKSCLYGFVHGYFLQHNEWQYVMLILVKVILLILICKYPALFKYSKLAKLTIMYFVMGISLDLLSMVGKLNLFHPSILSTVFILQDHQVTILFIIQSSLLFIMFFSIISSVVVQLYYQLKNMSCSSEKRKITQKMPTVTSLKPKTILAVIQKVENLYQKSENQNTDETRVQKFRRKVVLKMKDRALNGQKFKNNDSDGDDALVIKNKSAKGRTKKILFVPNFIESSAKPNLDSLDDQNFLAEKKSNFHSTFHKTLSLRRKKFPQIKSIKEPNFLTVTHLQK